MQTLIKWPGGKSKEFDYIKNLIPPFDRYVEPFFGGGAVYFQLKPQKAVINDICVELTDFYKFIKGEYDREKFKNELYEYVNHWEKIPKYVDLFENNLKQLYGRYRRHRISENELEQIINEYIKREIKKFNGLFFKSFCLDDQALLKKIISNLISKIRRIKFIEKHKGRLSEEDLRENIETAFRSGFYMHFRDIMNLNGSKYGSKYRITLAKKIANYYFIREFCYGSMFRFNSEGHFNIPYGGIGYNQKDFRRKVDYLFSNEVKNLFRDTKIINQDFEKIINGNKFTRKDFAFLDPPYDTDFSDYEKNKFDKDDQKRLASCLYNTDMNFVLIIKNTPFINNLYKNKKGIKINKFDKTYLYNVKGRNNRDAEHLVIYNF